MTVDKEDLALARKCMETIKTMRRLGLDHGGGTTATEDNLSRIVPKLLDAYEDRDRLQGIVDDIASETGHCLLLDDEEHEAPPLADWVRDIVKERDRLRAEWETAETGWNAALACNAELRSERDALKAKLAAAKASVLDAMEADLMALNPPHVRLVHNAPDFVAVKNWIFDMKNALTAAKETP